MGGGGGGGGAKMNIMGRHPRTYNFLPLASEMLYTKLFKNLVRYFLLKQR